MIEKLVCPNCQEELEIINKKYVCPCCEREWNEILLNSKKYYNVNCIYNLNTIIAQEYKVIYELINNKQIYGIIFQIKDLYEIITRIPVLIFCSIVSKLEQKPKSRELLYYLMSKPLSLGDWRYLLNLCNDLISEYDEYTFHKAILDLLDIVRKLVNSDKYGDIVHWRNSTIAHGAAKLIDDQLLYDDMACRLKEITTFFINNEALFNKIAFVDENDVELVGADCDYLNSDSRLYLKIDDQKYLLYPFFYLKKEGIYLFDRYFSKFKKVEIIEYINSIKETVRVNDIDNIFLENSIISNLLSPNFDNYSVEERNLCEQLLSSGEFLEPEFLVEWLKNQLTKKKNVFMLQMEKGMGKSFFVRGLDPYSADKIYLNDVAVKTFYINSTYNSRVDDFSVFVEDQMRKISKGNTLANSTIRLNIYSDNPNKEFAEFLNEYKEKYYKGKKLLFVFDGIDELNVQDGKNITDFIPRLEDINDDIYIMITCRTDLETDRLSTFCKNYINSFAYEKFVFYQNNDKYLEFIKKYYDLFIVKKIILFCKKNNIKVTPDFEKTDRKFNSIEDKSILNLTLLKELSLLNMNNYVRKYDMEFSFDDLSFDDNMYEIYFKNIKEFYGSKYYQKFINVLSTICLADRPVTLKELSLLSGNNNLNFAFLSFINSMKLFLDSYRGTSGTEFTISHIEQKNVIYKVFGEKIKEIALDIAQKIIDVTNEKFDFLSIDDMVYHSCFNTVVNCIDDNNKIKELYFSILKLPLEYNWGRNYNQIVNELIIIKNFDTISKFNFEFSQSELLKIAYLYGICGMNELILNNYLKGEYNFIKSMNIYENHYSSLSMKELYEYTSCLSIYGTLLWKTNRNEEALEVYKKSIKIMEYLCQVNAPVVSQISLLSEYVCYANIANSAKNYDEQMKILAIVQEKLPECEESEKKKRTFPFMNLCWFYYYRDNNDIENSIKSIEKAIKQYSECSKDEEIKIYPPDLIKCYNFLLSYLYKNDVYNLDKILIIIMNAEEDIAYIKKHKGYNDEDTYLNYLLSSSILFYKKGDVEKSDIYKKRADEYYNCLNDEKKENTKLVKYFIDFNKKLEDINNE